MADTAYSVLLQIAIDGVEQLRQDEQSGRATRIDRETPLAYNIPWYWGDNPVWKEYIKQFPNPRKEIGSDGWRKLLHEIAQTTGFGCFDERKSPQVKLMTANEQKEAAMARLVYFLTKRIETIVDSDSEKFNSLPGYNASDTQLLETNYPQGVKLLAFDEILAGVNTSIRKDLKAQGWKIEDWEISSTYAVARK